MKLFELMKENRYRSKDIAETCGVTPAAVSHWKHGKSMPSIENLRKIAQLFNVTVDELLGGTNDAR